MLTAECLVCRELRGEVAIPGGFLWEDEAAVAFHVPPVPGSERRYLGHLIVVTRRHVARLGDLDDAEAAAVGRISARLARALIEVAGADWVYSAVIGTGVAHFHQHLLPRYRDTPKDVAWHAVDEWDGAQLGDANAIVAFVETLKRSIAGRR